MLMQTPKSLFALHWILFKHSSEARVAIYQSKESFQLTRKPPVYSINDLRKIRNAEKNMHKQLHPSLHLTFMNLGNRQTMQIYVWYNIVQHICKHKTQT